MPEKLTDAELAEIREYDRRNLMMHCDPTSMWLGQLMNHIDAQAAEIATLKQKPTAPDLAELHADMELAGWPHPPIMCQGRTAEVDRAVLRVIAKVPGLVAEIERLRKRDAVWKAYWNDGASWWGSGAAAVRAMMAEGRGTGGE